MALFFFDTRDNDEFLEDDVGVDYSDFDTVKAVAARALAELAREVIPGNLKHVLAVEVRDELGPVMSATLVFEAVILRSDWRPDASRDASLH